MKPVKWVERAHYIFHPSPDEWARLLFVTDQEKVEALLDLGLSPESFANLSSDDERLFLGGWAVTLIFEREAANSDPVILVVKA